jgi:hypothetical protein
MKLPRLITGFWGRGDPLDPLLPGCDFTAFRGHCHTAARHVGGKVRSAAHAKEWEIATSYGYAVLDTPNASVAVLLNYYYPFIAFAEPMKMTFLDVPELAKEFLEFGVYQVLTIEELDGPIRKDSCQDLRPAEIKRIKYFGPKTIGEIIFIFFY